MAKHRSRIPDMTKATTRLKEIRGRLSNFFPQDYLGGLQTVCQQDDRHSKTDGHLPFRGRTNRCGKYTAISRPRDISTKLDLQLHVAACSGTSLDWYRKGQVRNFIVSIKGLNDEWLQGS